MSKFVKELLQKELEVKFDGVTEFVVVSTDGVSGNDNNAMRSKLSEKGVSLRVVRNSLMRKVVPGAAELFSNGPCTVAFGGDSVVDVAKEMVAIEKKIKAFELRGAYVDGTLVSGKGVVDLSKMPNRVELQGQIVQLVLSPAANLAGAIVGPASVIAGCLKTIIDKAEEGAA
ncbi:MAG: 50S ribosomal protein L10 [Phycisphaerae bacterium]|jgi:large subunit ribosomal protein L10